MLNVWLLYLKIVLKNETSFLFIQRIQKGQKLLRPEKKFFTGIISFPDLKIPPNPKYFKWFVAAVVSLKSSDGNCVTEQSDGAVNMRLKDADVLVTLNMSVNVLPT